MTDQPFHDTYAELTAGLPPSQLREALKRLSKCKTPLTDEEIAGEHPRVQACLERIAAAYARKKARSAVASKARRDAARGCEHAPRLRDDVAANVTTDPLLAEPLNLLEACTIECDTEGESSDVPPSRQPEPEPESEPSARQDVAAPLPGIRERGKTEPTPPGPLPATVYQSPSPPRRRLVRGIPKKEETTCVSSGNSLIMRR